MGRGRDKIQGLPNIEYWLGYYWIWTCFAKKSYIFVTFQGGGVYPFPRIWTCFAKKSYIFEIFKGMGLDPPPLKSQKNIGFLSKYW